MIGSCYRVEWENSGALDKWLWVVLTRGDLAVKLQPLKAGNLKSNRPPRIYLIEIDTIGSA